MNARERLEIIAQFVETLAPPIGPSDAAALRELDELMERAVEIIKDYEIELGDEGDEFRIRAAQAGYGEK